MIKMATAQFNPEQAVRTLGVEVRELFCDSRKAVAGGAFAAYPGAQHDGREYINDAVSKGAAGVFWDPDRFAWPDKVQIPNVAVSQLSARVGQLADFVYGAPSSQLFAAAVTGTNGKTTVAHFTAQLLQSAGQTVGISGTLGAGIFGAAMMSIPNTTPDAASLHRLLRGFADQGAQAAVMEASSHGIAQHRLSGIRLGAAALLNIQRDHLDYHGEWDNYRRVKIQLLKTEGLQTAIVNADDEAVAAAAAECAAPVWSFGARGKQLQLREVSEVRGGQLLSLDGECGKVRYFLAAPGYHNAQNFMAAALLSRAAGMEWKKILSCELSPPKGRLQRVNPGGSPAVYIDYAHTPDALSAVLSSFAGRQGRLLVVFGCGGARDSGKRRQMGRVAASLADVGIVTDDNPRSENPAAIRAEVAAGGMHLREVAGRGEAIATALEEASSGDIVVIAGKGHEEYQEIGETRRPFSDEQTARQLLRARGEAGTC